MNKYNYFLKIRNNQIGVEGGSKIGEGISKMLLLTNLSLDL